MSVSSIARGWVFLVGLVAIPGVGLSQQIPNAPPVALRPASFPEAIDDPHALQASMRSDQLFNLFDCPIGSQYIHWAHGERINASDEWIKVKHEYATSFWVTAVASRNGGGELFVAGMDAQGTSVIERWVFPVRNGGYHASYESSQPAIGTPQPEYCPSIKLFWSGI